MGKIPRNKDRVERGLRWECWKGRYTRTYIYIWFKILHCPQHRPMDLVLKTKLLTHICCQIMVDRNRTNVFYNSLSLYLQWALSAFIWPTTYNLQSFKTRIHRLLRLKTNFLFFFSFLRCRCKILPSQNDHSITILIVILISWKNNI